MDVILLERVQKLGQMGEIVSVRNGFARNYLIPQGKALRATDAAKADFERRRVQLEARNLERKGEAQKLAANVDGRSVTVLRQASESHHLYGSVSARGTSVTTGRSGSFDVERKIVNLAGTDRIVFRATHNGETCRGVINY